MSLCTLDRVKEFLPSAPTADNTIVQHALDASDAFLKKWCNRDFELTTYDELHSGTGHRELILNQFPITAVTRLATQPVPVIFVRNTDTTNSRATVQVTSTGVTLTTVNSATTTTNALTFATYTTLTALATAISLTGSWTATATSPYTTWASADLRATQGVFSASNSRQVALKIHTWEWDEFKTNEETGTILSRFAFPRGDQNIRVVYQAGFATVPEPIQQATAELAASVYNARNLNSNLQSETIGQYSYTLAAVKGFESLSAVAREALSMYKNRRVPRFDTSGGS